jgi:hypothetical protein
MSTVWFTSWENAMLTWIERGSACALLAGAGLVLSLASCAEAGMPGPHAQTTPGESEQFFAVALSFSTRASRAPVRVDPRPLKAQALLHSVGEGDILSTDSSTIRLRTAALAAAGIPLTNATEDWQCVFATGLRGPPPGQGGGSDPIWEQIRAAEPDSLRARREVCRSGGEFTSLAFGPPQAGTDPEHPRWWRIRVMRMMLHGWEVADLFLDRSPDGEWTVVHENVRVGAFS